MAVRRPSFPTQNQIDEATAWLEEGDDAEACRAVAAWLRYEASERKARLEARLTPGGSVECPHCHWGFAPSVIAQHIREKH